MLRRRIATLTPAQEALLPAWRDRWFRIGTCTDPADRPRAEAAIAAMYAELGRPAPRFVWTASPLTASLVLHLLQQGDRCLLDGLETRLKARLWDSLSDSLQDKVRAGLWIALKASLGGSLKAVLGSNLRAKLEAGLRDSLGTSLEAGLRDGLSLGADLESSLWDSLGDRLGGGLDARLWNSVVQPVHTRWWGQQEAFWLALYTFCRDLGVHYPAAADRHLRLHESLARSAMWWWPYDQLCIVCDRPELVRIGERGQLHAETGPAVRFRDGWSIYAVRGIRIPADVIEQPQAITVERIDRERNQEIRRVMIQRYRLGEPLSGAAAFIRDTGGERLDHEEGIGTLWRRERRGDTPIVMVEVINGTPGPDGRFRHYWLRVPPTIRTAREAVAWTYGLRPEEYRPAKRT